MKTILYLLLIQAFIWSMNYCFPYQESTEEAQEIIQDNFVDNIAPSERVSYQPLGQSSREVTNFSHDYKESSCLFYANGLSYTDNKQQLLNNCKSCHIKGYNLKPPNFTARSNVYPRRPQP